MSLSITPSELANGALPRSMSMLTLTNANGMQVTVSDWGASIQSVLMPNADGQGHTELVLNYQDKARWADNPYFFGVTVGRVSNRIGGAAFELEGRCIELAANEGNNQLHGGPEGLCKRFWQFDTRQSDDAVSVIFSIVSADGDQGFPGEMTASVEYRLDNANQLTLHYQASATETTPIVLTNHTYWNLAGTDTVLDQQLWLDAGHILDVDKELIPTGQLTEVAATGYDFNQPKAIGRDIASVPGGYDNFFVLTPKVAGTPSAEVARMTDPVSGRSMTITTTEPGIQFYSSNFLDGSIAGSDGKPLQMYAGICLETHGYPDAVNHPHFPNVIVPKGQVYQQTTVHRFSYQS